MGIQRIPTSCRVDDIEFDYSAEWIDGRQHERLTPLENRLLVYFLRSTPFPVAAAELAERVWRRPQSDSTGAYRQVIMNLRIKLERASQSLRIVWVRDRGYQLHSTASPNGVPQIHDGAALSSDDFM